MFTCCLILYIVNNLVSNVIQNIRLLNMVIQYNKVHSTCGVGQSTGMAVVLFRLVYID